ncbi:MAG: DUF1642 domain-containing protein [Lactococcus cremoris]|uniref:DUF1642 domain-containing protein n=1 Tax=Lactococcus lactis TaxID=1358 RepID=UPI00071E1EA6|nr:DUF1642 domain-containing protein [Lactococcus lactis]MRM56155.1 DUF1642 domain-containing protein [Lactococcus cremoris]ARE01368.1 prophage protein [Lactococcus lactis subsp. lactis]KSU29567.1 hypothetical protein ML8_0878 [Lactococcus lactis subsp. lactis]MCT0035524.1 DUF1642 domain-containing protein [Lactococcus lactis subsp. lactis]MCT3110316.1 DUF1642 domain-containing protein [Lactococcus lactis]
MDKTFKQRLEILPIKNIEHPVGNTKYYVAVHVKSLIAQADEEYQELFDKYSNLNDSYEKEVIRSSKLESQIANLKSQLQQQALPVVPDCVAEWISEDIENNTVVEDILTIIITSDDKDLKEYGLWIKKNPVTYVIARTLGYTVEKPQLFYLKSKSLLENEGESEEPDVDELYLNAKGNLVIYKGDAKKFTQSEIDSMQTGSHEQIEVTE